MSDIRTCSTTPLRLHDGTAHAYVAGHIVKARTAELFQFFKFTTRERSDLVTPVCMALLSAFGVFFIYSAQMASVSSQWLMQTAYLAVGAILYLATSLFDYRLWLKYAHWVYLLAVALLIIVLIPGVGTTHGMGARRWIDLGVASFQPSELGKIAVLFATASILTGSRLGTVRDSLQVLVKLALAVGIPMLLIIAEPDLGSALAIAPMVFAMLYVSNLSLRFFAGALGVFALVVGVVAIDVWRYANFMEENGLKYSEDRGAYEAHSWLPLKDYQRNRVLAFALPDKVDPMGIGWNSRQSLISVGSGGLTGKGWTEGTQARLGYLPRAVAHNDSPSSRRKKDFWEALPSSACSPWFYGTGSASPASPATASGCCSPSGSPPCCPCTSS
jgi:rod shape determining protein RodA